MRIWKSLAAVGAVAATATALAVAPAMADPINSHGHAVRPAPYDIVGVGSESISAVVDQLTFNYNLTVKKHSMTDPYIYSWDAVPANNLNDTTSTIVAKAGCKSNLRPDGSSAGITALAGNTLGFTTYHYTVVNRKHKKIHKTAKYPCVNYARSSRPRKTTDPAFGSGGIAFVNLAGDAVTYATETNSNVPNDLSYSQLQEIFGCEVPAANGFAANTWGALLGSSAKGASDPINPILPQAGSGTLSFWQETALGFTSDGEPTCGSAAAYTTAQQPEENEGISPAFTVDPANTIYPFSVGAYLAEEFHSAACGHKPSKTQNMFGCDETGVFHLDGITYNGKAIAPTQGSGVHTVTSTGWNGTKFHRFLYDVVPWGPSKADNHIPANLVKYFGPKGFFCKQRTVLASYGFEPTGFCGTTN